MIVVEYTKTDFPNLTGAILSFFEQICYVYDGKSIMKMFTNIDYQTVTYDSYLEQMLEEYENGIPKLWLLLDDNTIEGFSLGYIPTKKTAFIPRHVDYCDNFYICSFFVLPRFQRKHGGRLMIKKIVDYCYLSDIRNIFLNVEKNNSKAVNFYKKMGFVITSEINSEYFMNKLIYINLSNRK